MEAHTHTPVAAVVFSVAGQSPFGSGLRMNPLAQAVVVRAGVATAQVGAVKSACVVKL